MCINAFIVGVRVYRCCWGYVVLACVDCVGCVVVGFCGIA